MRQIGELVVHSLMGTTRAEVLVVAPGTSCRHPIKDATGRLALHLVEVLHAAMHATAP